MLVMYYELRQAVFHKKQKHIYKMTHVRIATFAAHNRSATLAELMKAQGLVNFTAQKAQSGKPYLLGGDRAIAGLSISHVRRARPAFSLMSVSETAASAIDAEVLSTRLTDETFLASIAAPEDAKIIKSARSAGRDPVAVIWTLKEAALKAGGEVMTDPRHLALCVSINGHIQATASSAASAPLQRCILRAFEMHINGSEEVIMVVAAIAGLQGAKNAPNLDVVCDNPDVRLLCCEWLT